MNKKELKQHLQKYLGDYLNEKGFTINSQNLIVKKSKDFEFQVGVSIKIYHELFADGLAPFIRHIKIEVPLTRIYCFDKDEKTYKDWLSSSVTVAGNHEPLDNEPSRVRKAMKFEIGSEYDVERLTEIIKEYMETTAIPFFEKYSDLQTINQEILANDMPYQEGIGYTGTIFDFHKIPIIGGDVMCILRRMFIMKYCADKRYDDFIKWYEYYINSGKYGNENDVIWATKIINDTKEYLSKLEIN